MNRATDTFRSRFGYHPCDFATYQKLKSLKKWYWQSVKDFHRWWRWQRKRPENRRGPEPAFCPVFVRNEPWFKPRRIRGQDAVRYYPQTLIEHGVMELLALARQPQAEPPTPLDESHLRVIDRLHAAAAEWFEVGSACRAERQHGDA